MILAKIIAIIILTDDTYDVRATLEECRKFNEAIQRLECSSNLINLSEQSIIVHIIFALKRCNFVLNSPADGKRVLLRFYQIT